MLLFRAPLLLAHFNIVTRGQWQYRVADGQAQGRVELRGELRQDASYLSDH